MKRPTFRNRARALTLLAEAAHQHGLPEPTYIAQWQRDGWHFQFDSLADLTQWALWADAVIETRPLGDEIGHRANGVIYDVPVDLLFAERVAVSA